ncbi:MAG: MFS transporter [Ruminococcaceae bacterium]|nr:MFS transporter [Oscillospiraceae bacterium]
MSIYLLYNIDDIRGGLIMDNSLTIKKDIYKSSRVLYMIEAAIEYFISLMVGGEYLALLTTEIGLSDSVTGILTSFVSLGFTFQLLAILFMRNGSVKRRVSILHSVNQLLFALLYLVPFIDIPSTVKTVIFIFLLLGGHALNNIVYSPKINWFMSLVDDKRRGRFTANKEIISLMGGMVFSFAMGSVIDYFKAQGNATGAFIVCGITLFALAVLHTLTLVFSKEKPETQNVQGVSTRKLIGELLHEKKFLRIVVLSVLWYVTNYATTPFYGTYKIKELGFSMTFVAILSAAYAVFRSLFSRPLGKFADKYSFAKMLFLCYGIKLVAYVLNMFVVPANGKILFTVAYMVTAIAFAGINSAEINLIYESVSQEKRVCALALKNTIAGLAGFGTTVLMSKLVEYIQNSGNMFLGMHVYAQQVTATVSAILTVVLLAYLKFVIMKKPENRPADA